MIFMDTDLFVEYVCIWINKYFFKELSCLDCRENNVWKNTGLELYDALIHF